MRRLGRERIGRAPATSTLLSTICQPTIRVSLGHALPNSLYRPLELRPDSGDSLTLPAVLAFQRAIPGNTKTGRWRARACGEGRRLGIATAVESPRRTPEHLRQPTAWATRRLTSLAVDLRAQHRRAVSLETGRPNAHVRDDRDVTLGRAQQPFRDYRWA
jgi:hypothetical protein